MILFTLQSGKRSATRQPQRRWGMANAEVDEWVKTTVITSLTNWFLLSHTSWKRPIDGMVKCNYDTASNTKDGWVLRNRLNWGSSLLGMAWPSLEAEAMVPSACLWDHGCKQQYQIVGLEK